MQSSGMPLTIYCQICRLLPGAVLPAARSSVFPVTHGPEICPDKAAYSVPASDTYAVQYR